MQVQVLLLLVIPRHISKFIQLTWWALMLSAEKHMVPVPIAVSQAVDRKADQSSRHRSECLTNTREFS